MKLIRYIPVVAALNAFVLFSIDCSAGAAQAKAHASRNSGNGNSRITNREENTNEKWFADPDRGWVRSDERHNLPRIGHEAARDDTKNRAKKANEQRRSTY